MKILVVGKGGREHALIQTLSLSPQKPELFSFPGSDAIFEIARPTTATDLPSLISWMTEHSIDLCVAGEESYLVTGDGLANLCEKNGIPCWGPPKESAQLEASKEFAKDFLLRNNIPTASASACDSLESSVAAIDGKYPTVLKFDGLAAGKGVAVCPDEKSALEFLDEVFTQKRFGPGRLLVEECLVGPEVSIFAAIVDDQYLILTPARDYKRLENDDLGPNTGGMGAVASRKLISQELLEIIDESIVAPTVAALQSEKLPYRGFLYFGLMLTPDGPKVIEYNCRFGDPECQAVMPLLSGDLASFCLNGAKGKLDKQLISFSDQWSVCVILASHGYPESSRSGDVISGLENTGQQVFHSGTKRSGEEWQTNGGRVLACVAQGPDRMSAVNAAHAAADQISFPGLQRRTDIGILNFPDAKSHAAENIRLTLTPDDIANGIETLAESIRKANPESAIALIGIRSRGDEVAERLLTRLSADDRDLNFGVLDISLYRDDFEHLRENPKLQESDIPFPIDGAHIILVDDVLFTGRTIRAALDALSDYGRPAKVELAVLIDRGHRELPIHATYTGIDLETNRHDHVHVSLEGTDGEDLVRVVTPQKP
ncbi:phosphoribosylamine--glycine ligase [Luteolibacter algae]|uniref:Bifunctional protein PyrR n=1 Tax=Luteolibacter algae TaxID=454151 RepID=A0ABW5D9Z8_9BACT